MFAWKDGTYASVNSATSPLVSHGHVAEQAKDFGRVNLADGVPGRPFALAVCGGTRPLLQQRAARWGTPAWPRGWQRLNRRPEGLCRSSIPGTSTSSRAHAALLVEAAGHGGACHGGQQPRYDLRALVHLHRAAVARRYVWWNRPIYLGLRAPDHPFARIILPTLLKRNKFGSPSGFIRFNHQQPCLRDTYRIILLWRIRYYTQTLNIYQKIRWDLLHNKYKS